MKSQLIFAGKILRLPTQGVVLQHNGVSHAQHRLCNLSAARWRRTALLAGVGLDCRAQSEK